MSVRQHPTARGPQAMANTPDAASSAGAPAAGRTRDEQVPPSADEALVDRCCAGDLGAFDELVRRHESRVVSLALRLVGDRDAAHDLAQEAFIAAFRNLSKFRRASAFSTWLFRITYNLGMDELTRRRRATERSVDTFYGENTEEGDGALQIPDASDTPEGAAQRRERKLAVRRAIMRLPKAQRVVLVLYDIQGVPYEEIASTLACPLGTVKSRLSRARLALLDTLGSDLELFSD
jgi:RNA polymerase sigma-70 factor (ECF subfamily)